MAESLLRVRLPAEVCRLFLVGVAAWHAAGCSDYRMSLAEFLERQAQMHEMPPTSEQAAALELTREFIDRHLGPYRVGPSDVIEVTIIGTDARALLPTVRARIGRDGEVDLPLVGKVKVADMELEDVEGAIHEAFVPAVVRQENGVSVHVELISVETTDVLVVGAVITPGIVELRRTERNMLHAIVAAQGVSEVASGRATLRRIRRPGESTTLNLTDPAGVREALSLDPLEDGDIVTVHAATPNTVFVGGLLNAPRPQMYGAGVQVNVLQAIAAAGGLRTDITPREGTLIRRLPDGTDAHVKLDLERIATGKDPNILLAAGDVLWVPFTWETRLQDFINRNLFLRAGISVNYNVTGIEFLNRQDLQASGAGRGNGGLQDRFDPLGFLSRNAGIQNLVNRPVSQP